MSEVLSGFSDSDHFFFFISLGSIRSAGLLFLADVRFAGRDLNLGPNDASLDF